MAQDMSDRNLLFGILALQLDFVSRDALILAMNSWVLDKNKPIGKILQAQGQLSTERLHLLDALVTEHVKQHGHDPQKSLASFQNIRSLPNDLVQIADPDLQASLVHVPPRGDRENPESTVGYVGPSTLPPHSRFVILREHARGGLGTVFAARDEELNRVVALKEIQESHADHQESRSRFLLEAKVTGVLEHPGIVPVYGLGTYSDGRPFYAMRFIKGDSLKEAVDRYHRSVAALELNPSQLSIELRKLLGRFQAACNAVEYAHGLGVLHRDLKPSNIMVGKFGETLVVDWGLAKLMGKTDGATTESALVLDEYALVTQAGQSPGTPAYMSPEQAAGSIADLGPRSDVYSLGATLFYVLTGQSPVAGSDAAEVRRKVQAGDILRPRAVNPTVPLPLEAICRKALSLAPRDRYPSAAALADDLEAWLADEPVSAWREPWNVRTARALRRHILFTTGMLAMLFGAILGLGIYFSIRVPRELSTFMGDPHSDLLPIIHAEQNGEDLLEIARLAVLIGSPEGETAPGEKVRAFRRIIGIQERLVADIPDRVPLRLDLAHACRQAAIHASKHGTYSDATIWFGRAIAIEKDLLEQLPEFATVKETVASDQGDLA